MNRLTTLLSCCLFLAACAGNTRSYDLIPYPYSLEPRSGEFHAAGAPFTCDPQLDEAARKAVGRFAELLEATSGQPSEMSAGDSAAEGFLFLYDSLQPAEGYGLDVTRRLVTVRASSQRGVLYAIQTMKQLLPVAIYGEGPAAETVAWTMPCLRIEDAPRFAYRGQHLDVSRHFFPVDEVKRVIDIMALHKLNTLHWHLTDDQGWRLEIKRYPRLTEVGSVRRHTMVGKQWGSSDNTPYGGYYTQDEVRDVVAYAAENGITVIPEIDLPGHMLTALAAYPELGCTGGPYEVWGEWGVAKEVLCAGNDKTFEFLEGVLTEVMELFPSEYIHIGGDECPKERWEQCPKCQARIRALGLKDDAEFKAEHYLQSYVTKRVEKFLADHGRRIIGWDEILEGELSPSATVMSWRGTEGGIKAAKMGHDVIMSPTSHLYFDYYQARDVENEPLAIGGYIPVERVYEFDPSFEGELTPEEAAHILGVQANLWTEYIPTSSQLEYMLLPREAALAEVQWCRADNRSWERFLGSLSHLTDIYRARGYNFAKNVFGVSAQTRNNPEKGCVEVTLFTQGDAPIYYTLDGSEPTDKSTRYTAPIEIRTGCTLRAIAQRDNIEVRPYTRTFTANKALAHPIVLNTQPRDNYLYGAPQTLVDGFESDFTYSNGDWTGWFGDPMVVTIDMQGASYSSVRLGTLVQKGMDIFAPLALKASVSEDGEHFTEAGSLDIPMETAADPDGLKSYTVTFPETSARYLRVEAQTVGEIPAWHGAHGKKGYLFVDEIVVE